MPVNTASVAEQMAAIRDAARRVSRSLPNAAALVTTKVLRLSLEQITCSRLLAMNTTLQRWSFRWSVLRPVLHPHMVDYLCCTGATMEVGYRVPTVAWVQL
jgi:hypothetical protein